MAHPHGVDAADADRTKIPHFEGTRAAFFGWSIAFAGFIALKYPSTTKLSGRLAMVLPVCASFLYGDKLAIAD
jgi:hypothetical protein